MRKLLFFVFSLLIFKGLTAQQYQTPAQKLILTSEDSLNANAAKNKTVISGYGDAFYQRDFNLHTAQATLDRVVLFVGHTFNDKISLFTELEMENAIVAGNASDE